MGDWGGAAAPAAPPSKYAPALHMPASISLCIIHQKGLKLESNFINRMIESLTLDSKGQRSQQYKLGEHAMHCLRDLHTTQARSQNFSLGTGL